MKALNVCGYWKTPIIYKKEKPNKRKLRKRNCYPPRATTKVANT